MGIDTKRGCLLVADTNNHTNLEAFLDNFIGFPPLQGVAILENQVIFDIAAYLLANLISLLKVPIAIFLTFHRVSRLHNVIISKSLAMDYMVDKESHFLKCLNYRKKGPNDYLALSTIWDFIIDILAGITIFFVPPFFFLYPIYSVFILHFVRCRKVI